MTQSLLTTVTEIDRLSKELALHEVAAKKESARLMSAIAEHRTFMARTEAGLDLDKIRLAETVAYVTDYSRGGDDRDYARQDAIKWFADVPVTTRINNLRSTYFGTKNYDRWSGQRSDHSYGMGPRHGSTCFEIGLREDARNRDLTAEEREAAIYYLVNIEVIQKSRVSA